MSIPELRQHPLAYGVLFALMCTLILFSAMFWQSRLLLRFGFLLFTVGYFVWGVITHSRSNTVTLSVMAEYAGVAILGGLLLLLLTF